MAEEVRTDEKICTMCGFEGICPERIAEILMIGISAFWCFQSGMTAILREYFPSTERNAEYREGIYVRYRYYDTSMVRVQYPFGFGLSYTEFSYSDLQVDEDGVTFTVANDGACGGAEVTQLYIGLPEAAIFRPYKELKGFKKVFLKAGERKKVRIPIEDKTFRYYSGLIQQV